MSHNSYFQLLLCAFSCFGTFGSMARADNGTVVSGTVVAIDPVNQIMRVQVTAVNGQFVLGFPQTNCVDYLVSPATVVVDSNNLFVSQANIMVGSQIRMQFDGPLATQIALDRNIAGWVGQTSTYANPYPYANRTCDHRSRLDRSHMYRSQFNSAPSPTNPIEPRQPSRRPASRYVVNGAAKSPSAERIQKTSYLRR